MKIKESEKAGLKLNIQKTKIMASGPITTWQVYGETETTVKDSIFRLQNHLEDDCSHKIKTVYEIKLQTPVGALQKKENSRKKHLLMLHWLH